MKSTHYWSAVIPLTLFVIREAIALKYSEYWKIFAQKYPDFDYIFVILEFIFAGGSWWLVLLGIFLIILFSIVYFKESDKNNQKEILEKAIDNTNTNNYFVVELQKKDQEIEGLKALQTQQTNISLKEKLYFSREINLLTKERNIYELKVKELESRLKNTDMETNTIEDVKRIMDIDGIEHAIRYLEKLNYDDIKKKNIEYARTLLIQADLYNIKNEYERADETYIQSISFNRTFMNTLAYISFLKQQNRFDDAINQLQIIKLELKISESQKASVDMELAQLYINYGRYEEAKQLLEKSYDKYKELLGSKLATNNYNLVSMLGMLGRQYYETKNYLKSEELHTEAIDLFEQLPRTDQGIYVELLVSLDTNLARLYSSIGKLEKAEKLNLKAINLQKKISKNNPSYHNKARLSLFYNNLATLYDIMNEQKKAQKYYLKALALRKQLFEVNPEAYSQDVAITLIGLSNNYYKVDKYNEAKKCNIKAIEIYRELTKLNWNFYRKNLAYALNSLGMGDLIIRQHNKAEKSFLEALSIFEELENENNGMYKREIALLLENIGIACKEQGKLKEVEKYYKESLKYFQEFRRDNSIEDKQIIANLYKKIMLLYIEQKRYIEAFDYYRKALNDYRKLVENNLLVYGVDYAQTYIVGVKSLGQPAENLDKAEKILKKLEVTPKVQALLRVLK